MRVWGIILVIMGSDRNQLKRGFSIILLERLFCPGSWKSSISTNPIALSSAMVLNAVFLATFNELRIWFVVSIPLFAIRRLKRLTLSIGAVSNAVLITKGISSRIIWFRPVNNAWPLAKFFKHVIALRGTSRSVILYA